MFYNFVELLINNYKQKQNKKMRIKSNSLASLNVKKQQQNIRIHVEKKTHIYNNIISMNQWYCLKQFSGWLICYERIM